MKIKFLAIIASLFILPLAITSCLDSDNEYELGTDDTISAFALDTIYGVTYKFTIDQVKKEIYNQDSVPFGSDTIIDKILIKTLSYSGWIVTGDSLFIQSDSVNFKQTMTDEGIIKPLEFKAYAPTGETSNTYKIWVNRHRVDPDSLVWGANPYKEGFSGGQLTSTSETKMISLGNESDNDILVYTKRADEKTIFYQKSKQWAVIATNGLPLTANISSLTNFNDTLYIVADNMTYRSINGIDWTSVTNQFATAEDFSPLTFKVETIITTFYNENDKSLDKTIAAIVEDEKGRSFATATINANKDLLWVRGEIVPKKGTPGVMRDFPSDKLSVTKSFATSTGGQQALLIGTPATEDTATTPWFSSDGLNWAPMEVAAKYALPKWSEPTILYYGNTLYAFGGTYDSSSENDFSTAYTSVNGIVWKKITRGFLFPNNDGVSKFKGRKGYSITVDKNNYIWMGWNTADEIWRGKLNRLTFEKQ